MNKAFSTIPKWVGDSVRSRHTLLRSLLVLGLCLLALWIVTGIVGYLVVETLWFSNLGYTSAFWLRLGTQTLAGCLVAGISLAVVGINLRLARRWQYQDVPPPVPNPPRSRRSSIASKPETSLQPSSRAIAFRWLLPLVVSVSLLISLLAVYYGRAALKLWQAVAHQPDTIPVIPNRLRFELVANFFSHWGTLEQSTLLWSGGVWLTGAIALLVYPRLLLSAIALLLSVSFGAVAAANWSPLLLCFHGRSFSRTDPLFNRDIGFYIFSLPIWQLMEFWLVGLALFIVLAVGLLYLLSGHSLSQGTFPGFSQRQQRHLLGLTGGLMLTLALSYWLRRYELLYSPRGVVFGAAYTEVHVQLPFYTALAGFAGAIALFLFWQARPRSSRSHTTNRSPTLTRTVSWSLVLLSLLCLLELAATVLIPLAVQRFVVQPNELIQEQPYIRRNIALTREAFNLEPIQVKTFNPQGSLTLADLQKNRPTINNIRLWDTRPLLDTNRQLQQIRPYYRFADADIDRYNLLEESAPAASPSVRTKQQVLISARELDYQEVPADAKTWVNEHLVYTHGYGFTLSPVNKVAPGGLPFYFVKDIGSSSQNSGSNLATSSRAIQASIPIGEPRIYFGEITNTYVMTNTKVQELDYPSGNDNVYNTYNGIGGIQIGTGWRRWLFARYLHDWQMLLTNSFKPETNVMIRRNIKQRVREIAPFLRFDQDPYLVTADIGCLGLNVGCDQSPNQTGKPTQNYLYWVMDAYTVSDHYPYSAPSALQSNTEPATTGDRFNYIRNSVKVVIDAYNGSINFYVAEPTDPMIQAWTSILPKVFKPLDQLPASLRSHIRYPIDLFSIQSERLMTFHMTDPQVFYNREDQWQIPTEIYGTQPRPVEPYFLITNLPAVVESEEFILLLPFKPTQRNNLTAWLAARSDGDSYGKQLLYVFPKQRLVFGIEQLEARINQDPVISQKISLWNRQGSRVLQGNLLVIPIEQSLLYVEPLYLEAEQNSLPTLVSVVVAYEDRIVMSETLEQALQAIFQASTTISPAIVRPVE